MGLLNKIIETIRKPNADPEIITTIKGNCTHNIRGCHYGRWRLKVDSLMSESVPGVTETIITELCKIKGDKSLRLLNLGGGIGQMSSIFDFLGFDVINTDIAVEKPDEKNIQIDFNKSTELPFFLITVWIALCVRRLLNTSRIRGIFSDWPKDI